MSWASHACTATSCSLPARVVMQECIAAAAAERKKLKSLVTEPTVAFKVCGHCKERKAAAEFHRTRTRSDGLSSSCKVRRSLTV